MATSADKVRSEVIELAGVLLDHVERIAERHVARMQELLPSYGAVPAEELLPAALTITSKLLEAVRDPDPDPDRAEDYFRVLAESRIDQGIAGDEVLQAWRILLEVVREDAHPVADRLGFGDDALLGFVEATLQWGDVGMRRTASAFREAEIREVERLVEEQAALRRVATLVAQDAPSSELLSAVVGEVGTLFGADFSGMVRFEDDASLTTVATWAAAGEHPPVPTRWEMEPGDPASMIQAATEPARVDDWTIVPGTMAAVIRDVLGVRSSIGCPVLVEGRLWGALAVHFKQSRPLPTDTESHIAQFTDLVATAIANAESRGRADRLADERAALGRVATLVAQEAPLTEVFAMVAEEAATTFGEGECALFRDGGDGTASTVAAWAAGGASRFQVGARVPADGGDVLAFVLREGEPRRIDVYSGVGESLADGVGDLGDGSAVGCPIVVGGRVWGAIVASTAGGEPCLPESEDRIARFAELVATAIGNAETRADVRRLAEEQAALRRVATLVAEGQSPSAILDAVAAEAERALGAAGAILLRYEPDDEVTVVARRIPSGATLPPGTRQSHKGFPNVSAMVRATGQPARNEQFDFEQARGPFADASRAAGWNAGVAAPIVVSGRLWGVLSTTWREGSPPADTEERLAKFAQLLGTAIANADSGEALRQLADQQAALRRVATLVAREASHAEVFTAIAGEIRRLLDADEIWMLRYERDTEAVMVATTGAHPDIFPVGSRWPLGDENVTSRVFRTGKPARLTDWGNASGKIAEAARSTRLRALVGTPIMVRGRLWGTMLAGTFADEPLPPDTESRLGEFTELMAIAIANAEARSEVRRLADEQAALRRVATLVAGGAPPAAVFDAVVAEIELLLPADGVALIRYESADEVTFLAHRGRGTEHIAPGTRASHADGESATAIVWRTKRPARFTHVEGASGALPGLAQRVGRRSAVGAPVLVEGRLWGCIVATWQSDTAPPPDTEERMAQFTQLLETAIANADSRDQLTASRARLVTEADEARRRVVRDLHDGAQQRLLQTIVTLGLAQRALEPNSEKARALIAEALAHARQGNSELRELAHGILPAILIQGGLRGGIGSIVTRLDLPVDVDVPRERFPAEVEASAYFVVAEALTNVVKHSHAAQAEVRARMEDGLLRVEVRDDGVGGADPSGHGLVGLGDRVAAMGGQLVVETPQSGGTLIAALLPVRAS